jgi:hypothetical protein
MIDNGDLVVDGHHKNSDHKAFKEPFPPYKKGETSKPKPNNKVNYTYSNYDNIINMVEPMGFEYCDVITIKGKQDKTKSKTPFVLKVPTSNTIDNTPSQQCANAVTCSCAKLVLKGPAPSTPNPEQQKYKTLAGPSGKGLKITTNPNATSYSVLEQLKWTNTQISIFELLKILLAHRQILDKALIEANVPQDLNLERFQSMIGHLTSPYLMTFSEEEDNSLSHPHNQPLHVEVVINQTRVHRVLIDNGMGLNIVSAALLRQLNYFEESIDPWCKITIKAYDEVERKSLGLVVLPIHVSPIERDVTCQVLDIALAYNILLGWPWIYEMHVMSSTYHQCIKLPFHGSEVTIPTTTSYTCNMLKAAESFIPTNRESTDYHDTRLKQIEQSFELKETSMGEYHIELVLSLTSLLKSPCHYGRPSKAKKPFVLTP